MTEESLQAVNLMFQADTELAAHDLELATAHYLGAKLLAQSARSDDPLFLKEICVADCDAGLSASLGGAGKYDESLASADAAIAVYESFEGEKHRIDPSRLLMAAISRASSLANLGRPTEAFEALSHARELCGRYRGLDRNVKGLLDSILRQSTGLMAAE